MISIFPKQARAREGAVGAQWRQYRKHEVDATTRSLPAGVGAPAGPDEGWCAHKQYALHLNTPFLGCVKCTLCFCLPPTLSFLLPYLPLCLCYISVYLLINLHPSPRAHWFSNNATYVQFYFRRLLRYRDTTWLLSLMLQQLEELSSDLSHGHGAVRLLLRRWGKLLKRLVHRTARSLVK